MKRNHRATLVALFNCASCTWLTGRALAQPPEPEPAPPPARAPLPPRLILPTAPGAVRASVAVAGIPEAGLPSVAQLLADITRAERESNADGLLYAYGQAVRDPGLARGALALLLSDYYDLRSRATSAPQASQAVDEATLRFLVLQAAQNQLNVQQNQQIMAQNERIIALLERLVAQTAPPPAGAAPRR